MAEKVATKTVDFDIYGVFESTKQGLQQSIERENGKMELLDQLTMFFKNSNLRVVQDVVEQASTDEKSE